jgi:hypothetical protein
MSQPENLAQTVQPQAATGSENRSGASGLFVVLFYAALAVVAALVNDTSRPIVITFVVKYHWYGLAAAAIVAALLLFPRTRQRVRTFTVRGRIALVIFVGAPLLLFVAGLAVYLPPSKAVAYLRGIFLVTVCLLPAILYYLFISTRKSGLLNEYIINLDRLGLLPNEPSSVDGSSDAFRRARLQAYLQKFEAVYRPLPDPSLKQLDASSRIYSNPSWLRSASAGLGNILTADTTIPVIIATLLIVLGWLPLLPPRGPIKVDEQTAPLDLLLKAFTPVATPVLFGFLGAYFFSLQMLFRRFVRRDLSSNAYVAASMRIIMAVVGTWVMTESARVLQSDIKQESLSVIGFIIGFFPMVLWQVLASAVKKITSPVFFFRAWPAN